MYNDVRWNYKRTHPKVTREDYLNLLLLPQLPEHLELNYRGKQYRQAQFILNNNVVLVCQNCQKWCLPRLFLFGNFSCITISV